MGMGNALLASRSKVGERSGKTILLRQHALDRECGRSWMLSA